mmetsp:Transcript_5130/g.15020  ORF Transcript_5130/g.15020 Transcript_5130/m.15020 type:complete len:423 (-) Transcript_5130:114-1382(-)
MLHSCLVQFHVQLVVLFNGLFRFGIRMIRQGHVRVARTATVVPGRCVGMRQRACSDTILLRVDRVIHQLCGVVQPREDGVQHLDGRWQFFRQPDHGEEVLHVVNCLDHLLVVAGIQRRLRRQKVGDLMVGQLQLAHFAQAGCSCIHFLVNVQQGAAFVAILGLESVHAPHAFHRVSQHGDGTESVNCFGFIVQRAVVEALVPTERRKVSQRSAVAHDGGCRGVILATPAIRAGNTRLPTLGGALVQALVRQLHPRRLRRALALVLRWQPARILQAAADQLVHRRASRLHVVQMQELVRRVPDAGFGLQVQLVRGQHPCLHGLDQALLFFLLLVFVVGLLRSRLDINVVVAVTAKMTRRESTIGRDDVAAAGVKRIPVAERDEGNETEGHACHHHQRTRLLLRSLLVRGLVHHRRRHRRRRGR